MLIGEIVEILIREKDNYSFGDIRKTAVEEACNVLDKLPRDIEACDFRKEK